MLLPPETFTVYIVTTIEENKWTSMRASNNNMNTYIPMSIASHQNAIHKENKKIIKSWFTLFQEFIVIKISCDKCAKRRPTYIGVYT